MSFDQSPVGFALLCDQQGIIQQVIQDGIGIEGLTSGQSLEKLVDSGSRFILLTFLVDLRSKGSAFDCEINIPASGQVVTLRLAGVVTQDSLMLIGARTPAEALDLCDMLMKTRREQAAALRTGIIGQMQTAQFQNGEDASMYDEISRLNNELITLQRDLAKKNAQLEQLYAEVQTQAMTDPLTGLYNRRGFFEVGDREIERSKRYGHPLSAIMFDLDHFKMVNDTHGHLMGDIVLKEIAARGNRQLRKIDIFGHYGGDEFSVLLPETSLDDAIIVAKRLHLAFNKPIEFEQTRLTITISLGVAVIKDNTANLQELLLYADRALYAAKESGRNGTCIDHG